MSLDILARHATAEKISEIQMSRTNTRKTGRNTTIWLTIMILDIHAIDVNDYESGYPRKTRDSGKDIGDTDIDDKYKKDRKKYGDLDDNNDSVYTRKSRDSEKDIGDTDIDDKYKKDRKEYGDLDDDIESGYPRQSRDSRKDIGYTDIDDKYKKDRKKYSDLDDDKDYGYQQKSQSGGKDNGDSDIDPRNNKDRENLSHQEKGKEVAYNHKSKNDEQIMGNKDISDKYGKDGKMHDVDSNDNASSYSRRFGKPEYGEDDGDHYGKGTEDVVNTDDSDIWGKEIDDRNRRNRRGDKVPPDVTLGDDEGKISTDQQGDKNTANSERRTPSPRRPESLPIEKIMPDVTDDMRNDTKPGKPLNENDRQTSKKAKSHSKKDDIEQELIQKAKEVTAEIKTLNDAWMSDREDNSSSGDTSPLGHLADTKPELPNTFFMGVVQSDFHTAERDESRSDEIRGKNGHVGEVGSDNDVLNTLMDKASDRLAQARSSNQPETFTEELVGHLKPDEVRRMNGDQLQKDAGALSTHARNPLESVKEKDRIDSLVGYTYDEYCDDSISDLDQSKTAIDGIVGKDNNRVGKSKYGTPSFVNEIATNKDQEESSVKIPGLKCDQASTEEIPHKKRGLSVHFKDEICDAPDSIQLTDATPNGGKELTRDCHRKTSSEEGEVWCEKADASIYRSLSETSKRPDDTDVFSFSTSADIKEGKDVQPPKILKASSDVTIYEGQNLEISWEVQGTPEPRMKIYKDGEPIELFDGMGIVQDGHEWTLSIPDVIRDDAGCYELHIINRHGTDKSEVKVQVHRQTPRTLQKELAAPAFTAQPEDTTLKEGDDLVLKCAVQGFPPPQVLWLRDGEELSDGEEVEILEENESQCLIVWEARPEHAGQYICRAVNSQGTTEVKFNVDIQDWSSEEEDLHGNDTKSSKSGEDEKMPAKKSEENGQPKLDEKKIKDENTKSQEEIQKEEQGKKEAPKVAEKPKDRTKKPVVEEEMIASKTENVNECLPEDEDEKYFPSKKEAVPPKPAAKPKDKLRKPVVEEIVEDRIEKVTENIPSNSGETVSVAAVEKEEMPEVAATPKEVTKTPVIEGSIQDKEETLKQCVPIDGVDQALMTTVREEDHPKVGAKPQEKYLASAVEGVIEENASECKPFDEAKNVSATTVKNDKVPKVAAKPKVKSKTPIVEEIIQDKSEMVNECVPLDGTEKASVTTVKTDTVPKVAAKPKVKSKTPIVEEIIQDKSEMVNECVSLDGTEKASVRTVKTDTVPKEASKPTETHNPPIVEEIIQDKPETVNECVPADDTEKASVTTVKTDTVPKVASKPTETHNTPIVEEIIQDKSETVNEYGAKSGRKTYRKIKEIGS
ncbi:titin-like [Mizuhopecten yessoensis]|uniref:titin-like n=1 Tax=Mizuhopecten yessoensis TaxID=6573 RepID=UPI000B45CE35|nr:titin-like [Mizuhopecten yessoensis]